MNNKEFNKFIKSINYRIDFIAMKTSKQIPFFQFDDIRQELLITSWNAYQKYQDGFKTTKSTYVTKALLNKSCNLIKKSKNKYHNYGEEIFSYLEEVHDPQLYNLKHKSDIEDSVCKEDVINCIQNKLKENQYQKASLIFNLLTQNIKSCEISKITNIKKSRISQIISNTIRPIAFRIFKEYNYL